MTGIEWQREVDRLEAELRTERAKVEQLVGDLHAASEDYTDVVRTLREVRAVLVRHAGGAVARAKALIAEALG